MSIPQGMPTAPQALVGLPNVGDDLQLVDEQRVEIQERTKEVVRKFQQRRDELKKLNDLLGDEMTKEKPNRKDAKNEKN